ncbi:MAG: T9SS type A sorting domain-containing protein [Bacteroidota bacterium]
MKKFLLFLAAILYVHATFATHIIGSSLSYTCTDPFTQTYEVKLTLYRDCLNGQAPFDALINMFVFDGNGGVYSTISIPAPAQSPQLQYAAQCNNVPPNICVEFMTYTTSVSLPLSPSGYAFGWSRCCRNFAIDNLQNPLGAGMTMVASLPGSNLATYNNSPEFQNLPLTFACANQPFDFDHSAYDADGDSIVYELVAPYTGINFLGLGTGNPQQGGNDPTVDPFVNPMGGPPYQHVTFNPGFTAQEPFGTNSTHFLDPQTGYLNFNANQAGIFAYAIQASEYRNGNLLGTYRFDFQMHVITCKTDSTLPTIVQDISALNHVGDTIFITDADSFCYPVSVTHPTLQDSIFVEALGNAFQNQASFTQSGANPVNGQVCWKPNCATYPVGDTLIPLVISALHASNCPNIAGALDTIWVKVSSTGSNVYGPMPVSNFEYNTNGTAALMINKSQYGSRYIWDFQGGDRLIERSPVYDFGGSATYDVTLIAENGCGRDSFTQQVSFSPSNIDYDLAESIQVMPNPFQDFLRVSLVEDLGEKAQLELYDMSGRLLLSRSINSGVREVSLPTGELQKGIYLLSIKTSDRIFSKKLLK